MCLALSETRDKVLKGIDTASALMEHISQGEIQPIHK